MHIYCDHCDFERVYTGSMAPVGKRCPVCDIGILRQGRQASGFTITNDTFVPVPRNPAVLPYHVVHQGAMGVPENFNFFVGELGDKYRAFIRENSVYVGKLTNILIPEPKRFAWLTPYTGNKHNRAHFTQLVLSHVARAKFIDNKGKFPRLIEPFVGSGQIFMNACYWGPSLGQGMSPFSAVIAGDLNHYVIGAYRAMSELGAGVGQTYVNLAAQWDATVEASYAQLLRDLDRGGKTAIDDAANNPAAARLAAFKYIWLVNRCTRGTKLNNNGGVLGTLNREVTHRLAAIRARELKTLDAAFSLCNSISFDFACRDFSVTTALAEPEDIVFMDCPFPTFTMKIPPEGEKNPEQYAADNAHTYGTGDDGANFQTKILKEAKRLTLQGTTVILCNFANPGLIKAYADLVENDVEPENLRFFTYTYRSPSTQSDAYQLTVLPGGWNEGVTNCHQAIMADWKLVGGDDNATAEDFFAPVPKITTEDRQYGQLHDQKERKRQDDEEANAFEMVDEGLDDYFDDDDEELVDEHGELNQEVEELKDYVNEEEDGDNDDSFVADDNNGGGGNDDDYMNDDV